jgi:CRP-like cAMP-binding protein
LDRQRKVRNRLLAALKADDWAALAPELERVKLPSGFPLYEDGESIRHVLFPDDCVVSVVATLAEGNSPEMMVIGPEGAVGLVAWLAPWEAFGRYTVQVPGEALRIPIARLQEIAATRPKMHELFVRCLQALLAQTLQTVACNAVHTVEARCCRWILMIHDRTGADQLALTHEFLASMLGVQRPTVSIVTRTLQMAGLITQGRKVITVRDRAALEEAACECYGHIRRRFERLLPNTYTSETPAPHGSSPRRD